MLGFVTHEVEDLVDLLLVTGKWSDNNNSRTLSDAYQTLAVLLEEIAEFDESIGDDGARGSQLRTILVKCDRAKKYDQARRAIAKINDVAKNLVSEGMTRLLVLSREFKLVVEDAARPGGQRLVNWPKIRSQLAAHSPQPDANRHLTAVYKRLSAMYRLLELMPTTGGGRAAQGAGASATAAPAASAATAPADETG